MISILQWKTIQPRLRRGRARDRGGAFQYSRRLTRLMDKPLWGLKVLKFDGAIAPRVLRFDAPPARGLWWAPYIYRRRPLMKNPLQPPCRRWKCIPPLVANATTFPPLRGGTTTRAYCRDAYEENVSRCFILSPGWGKVRRSRIRGSRAAANHQNAYYVI